jgi:hypothetical protein
MLRVVRIPSLSVVAVLAACSTDTFEGNDASPDSSFLDSPADSPDTGLDSASDSSKQDGTAGDGSLTFCDGATLALFCDDYDATGETNPWSKWDTFSSSGLAFGTGHPGRALAVSISGVGSTAFESKTTTKNASHLALDIHLEGEGVASATLVQVTVGSSTFNIAAGTAGIDFTTTGSSGGSQNLGPEDNTTWHHFDVAFTTSMAMVTEDEGSATATVPFATQVTSSFKLDIGMVTTVSGGAADFDNVLVY